MTKNNNFMAAIFYAMAIVIFISIVPSIFNSSFYFEDDWQGYFLPNFLEIARIIKLGKLPLLTDRLWVGGMFLGEYQTAIFHPVSVLLYLLIDRFDNLNTAASVFTIIHMAILSVGTTSIALIIKCDSKSSILAGVIVPTMSSLVYWGSKIWIPMLVSMSWMSIAFVLLLLVFHNKRWFALTVIANAFVFLSGWPVTNLAFIITIIFSLLVTFLHTRAWENVVTTAVTVVVGFLLASPAILPVAEIMEYSSRSIDPDQWKTSIDLIPGIGVPSFMTVWKNFGHQYYPVHNTPILYVSWFIPLLLVNISWKSIWDRRPLFRLLVGLTVLFFVMAMLPGFWQIRWAFRFLPFAHFFIVLLSAYAITHDVDVLKNWISPKNFFAIIIPFYIALVYAQELWPIHILFMVLIALFIGLHIYRQMNNKEVIISLLFGHVLLFIVISLIWRTNYQGVPIDKHEIHRSKYTLESGRRLALYTTINRPEEEFWTSIAPGNRALFHFSESINGYSPIFPIGFQEKYCFNFIGGVCPNLIKHLFEIDKISGRKFIDLLNISTVVAEKGNYSNLFGGNANEEWKLIRAGVVSDTYIKSQNAISKTDIFASDSLEFKVIETSISKKVILIKSLDNNQNSKYIIWSRPWYPGWRVKLNDQELRADRVADVLIGVILPKESNGTLTIEYWPRTLTLGIWLSTFAMLIILISIPLSRRL